MIGCVVAEIHGRGVSWSSGGCSFSVRPDKWDGSEKAWPTWSFVMKACAGAIDQELSADMAGAEISTDAVSNESMTPRKSRSVQLYLVLIMLYSGKEQCKVGCDDAGGVGFSVSHKTLW